MDSYSCNVCGEIVFYSDALDSVASLAVICRDCAETHAARALTREQERALFGLADKEE